MRRLIKLRWSTTTTIKGGRFEDHYVPRGLRVFANEAAANVSTHLNINHRVTHISTDMSPSQKGCLPNRLNCPVNLSADNSHLNPKISFDTTIRQD